MLNLTAGGLSGGYRKYLRRVVPMLRAEGSITELLIALPPGHERQPGIEGEVVSWAPGEHWRGYPSLRARVRAWKPDVVFIPTARYIDCQAPTLSMVQNMLPMLPPTFKDGVPTWAKLRVDAMLARRATSSASRIIAVSEYVRDFLIEQWNVPATNVGVVYYGVDTCVSTAPPKSMRSFVNEPFLFTAGSLDLYRGFEDAIQALPHIAERGFRLVIAGQGLASYRNRMVALATKLQVAERIVWLGQVDPSVMAYFYQHCKAFLMTSRVEACPNIALEAMASGAQCISTSCRPMPEFFGHEARYYSAGDATALASHIDAATSANAEETQAQRVRAQQRAGLYTWDNTARGVIRELKATLEPRT